MRTRVVADSSGPPLRSRIGGCGRVVDGVCMLPAPHCMFYVQLIKWLPRQRLCFILFSSAPLSYIHAMLGKPEASGLCG
jgi:hypothetical protein